MPQVFCLFVWFLSYIAQCLVQNEYSVISVECFKKNQDPAVSWQIDSPTERHFYLTILHSCLRILILPSDKAQILKFSYSRSILDLFSSSDLLKQKWEIFELILLSFPTFLFMLTHFCFLKIALLKSQDIKLTFLGIFLHCGKVCII